MNTSSAEAEKIMKKNKQSLYSRKIFLMIFLFNILLQTIFCGLSFARYFQTKRKTNAELAAKQREFFKEDIDYIFGNLKNLAKYAESELDDYTTKYWQLKNQDKAYELYIKAKNIMNNAQSDFWFADGIYVFGENKNQKSFWITKDGCCKFEDVLLNQDDLKTGGVTELLYKLPGRLPKESVGSKEFDELYKFTGDSLLYGIYGKNTYILIKISESAFDIINSMAEETNIGYSVENAGGEVLLEYKRNMLMSEQIELTDGLMLNLQANRMLFDAETLLLIAGVLIFNILMTIILYKAARHCAHRIVRPYIGLSNIMKLHSKEDELKKIDIYDDKISRNGKSFILKNIYTALIYAVVLPSIFAGMFYSVLFLHSIKDMTFGVYNFRRMQTEYNILRYTDEHIHMIRSIDNEEYNRIQTQGYLIKQYGENGVRRLNEYEPCIVIDRDFNIISNTTGAVAKMLRKDLSEYMKNLLKNMKYDKQIIAASNEIFGDENILGVSKIRDSKDNITGYCCVLYNNNIFNGIGGKNTPDIKIYSGDTTVYSTFAQETESGNLLVIKDNIKYIGWTVYTAISKDMLYYKSYRQFTVNIILMLGVLIVVILISWGVSFKFVNPLMLIGESMDSGGTYMKANNNNMDEIEEVIVAYNRMIDKIHILIDEQTRMKTREQEIIALKTKAELNVLQHQINPHFLYNTLEVINLQALQFGNEEASKIIVALTKLFRYSTTRSDATVTVREEIEHIQSYIKIQEYRFGNLFKCYIETAEESLECKIPKLIIQPLIENAIVHGMNGICCSGEIHIATEYENGSLSITVTDNGIGIRKEKLDEIIENMETDGNAREAVGMANIYKRLKLYYGESCEMTVESTFMKGTKVNIIIKT